MPGTSADLQSPALEALAETVADGVTWLSTYIFFLSGVWDFGLGFGLGGLGLTWVEHWIGVLTSYSVDPYIHKSLYKPYKPKPSTAVTFQSMSGRYLYRGNFAPGS